MNKSFKNIVLDCERMKYPNSGLYHYCLNLATTLQQNINEVNEKLYLYVREKTRPDFKGEFSFLDQHSLHKLYLPKKGQFDIWHCTYQGSNYFPFTKKMPVVLTIHDLNFLYDKSKNEQKKNKAIKLLATKIASADYLIAISAYVLNDIQQHFDLTNKRFSVIYNGCNKGVYDATAMPENKKINAPFLFTIGTVVDKKNFHVLPCLLKNNNRLLVIAGELQSESYKAKIIAEAIKHKVQDRVIFTGPISEEEKSWYMNNCECFVFPSLAEGFGLPVIEAMYFGKPVILSKLTSLPEIGGDAAYYFNDFEPANMLEVLEESLSHYQTHNPVENIKARAAIFDWNKAAIEHLEVYRSLY